jgi:hypothetical protein
MIISITRKQGNAKAKSLSKRHNAGHQSMYAFHDRSSLRRSNI